MYRSILVPLDGSLPSLVFHGAGFPLRAHASLANPGCFLPSPLTHSMTELCFPNLQTPTRSREGRFGTSCILPPFPAT